MNIIVKKFGIILTSRKDGKEAYLALQPLLKDLPDNEIVNIDFAGVASLSPSWGDEFITPLQEKYGDKLVLENTSNSSVSETLDLISKVHAVTFNVKT